MNGDTSFSNEIANIKANSKYLKLSYSFHNATELVNEHTTLNSTITQFYADLLQKECDVRNENGKESRIRNATFPYKKYLSDLDVECLPQAAQEKINMLQTLEFIRNGQNLILAGNPGTRENSHCYRFGD